MGGAGGVGGGSGIGACGSVKVPVAVVPLPPHAVAALYGHIGGGEGGGGDGGGDGGGGDGGGDGGGGDGGGGDGGGGAGGGEGGGGEGGGWEGGWQWPSQSTMYSTCTKLPSYGFSLTAGVALVTNVYVPSGLMGSSTCLAHSKKPPTLRRRPRGGGSGEEAWRASGVKVSNWVAPGFFE